MDHTTRIDESALADLVSMWQQRRAEGQTLNLVELCRDCPDLLPKLEQRIAALDQMDFLVGDMHQTATVNTNGSVRAVASSPSPEIPGYEILGELGRGGMGVVYKARHLRLNRIVALKMILAGDFARPSQRVRFLAEAEVVAALRHPHIVALLEYGEYQGQPFFTLEYMPGGSLAEKLNGVPQPTAAAARLVEQLAHGIHFAHTQGIVHRDLKPANILLAEDGTAKISDFGLARRGESGSGLTGSGEVLGTPSYMAPEQAGGDTKHAAPAADIYALGAILYECLTGRPPFRAPTTMETVLQVLRQEPVAVRQLQPQTPVDLATICHKCLQKEPHKRYTTALELAEDCAAFREGKPIRARPIGAISRGWRWCRRNRTLAGALAFGVLSLILGSILSVGFGFRAEAARESEQKRAESEASAKVDAEQARRDAQGQAVDLCVASGLTAAREGDHSLALVWFARAVQLAEGEPQLAEANRIRIANWLRQVCLPEGMFTVDRFRQKQDRFRQFQFSPDGNYLLVVASTGECLVWDRQRKQRVTLPEAAAKASAAAWQPDANVLAVAEKTGRIHFLTAPDFRTVEEVAASGSIAVLAYSRDGKRLAWGGSDGARVWDRDKKAYLTPPLAVGRHVVALSFSSQADLLALSSRDNKALVYRIPSTMAEPLFAPVPNIAGDGQFSHAGYDIACPRFAAGDEVLLTIEPNKRGGTGLTWRSATTGKLQTSAEDVSFAFAVSQRGNYIASLGETKRRLWNANRRQVVAPIPMALPMQWNEHVVFATDEQMLVTCDHEGRARFFAVTDRPGGDTLSETYPSVYHPMEAVRLSLSPDGHYLATALWDGSVYLWRLPLGPPIANTAHTGGMAMPTLSPDKKHVLPRGISFRNSNLLQTRVYDALTGKLAGSTIDPGGLILDAAFSPDGAQVATSSSAARTPILRNELLFAPDGQGGCVQIWDWKTGQRLVGPIPTPGEPRGLAFRPDGRLLAVVCADYRVLVVDAKTGEIKHRLDPGLRTRPQNANQWISNGEARFSPDGRFLVTWEMTPHVHVWDAERGELLHTLPHNDRVGYVAFHPVSPHLLATAGWGNDPRVWDLTTGKLVVSLKHPQSVGEVNFAGDGQELITIAADGVLRSWDWQAGKLRDGWPLHPSGFHDFQFTSDRRWLVTINAEELQVLDWRTKVPVSPRWKAPPYSTVQLVIPDEDRRAIVGGFSTALVGYDLEMMRTPLAAPVEDLLALTELTAGRRILSQGNVVPLNSAEWLERWQRLQRQETSSLLASLEPTAYDVRQRAAQRLIVSLYERLIRKPAVLRHLRQTADLEEELRAEAILRAQEYEQDPIALNREAWHVVRSPDSFAANYARALLQAEEACSLQPQNGLSLNTLGVAQYRVGQYRLARDTLSRSDRLNRRRFGKSLPADLAFLSMAQYRLGFKQQALYTFERLREVMPAAQPAKATAEDETTQDEDRAFFREAAKTLGVKDGPSQPEKTEPKKP